MFYRKTESQLLGLNPPPYRWGREKCVQPRSDVVSAAFRDIYSSKPRFLVLAANRAYAELYQHEDPIPPLNYDKIYRARHYSKSALPEKDARALLRACGVVVNSGSPDSGRDDFDAHLMPYVLDPRIIETPLYQPTQLFFEKYLEDHPLPDDLEVFVRSSRNCPIALRRLLLDNEHKFAGFLAVMRNNRFDPSHPPQRPEIPSRDSYQAIAYPRYNDGRFINICVTERTPSERVEFADDFETFVAMLRRLYNKDQLRAFIGLDFKLHRDVAAFAGQPGALDAWFEHIERGKQLPAAVAKHEHPTCPKDLDPGRIYMKKTLGYWNCVLVKLPKAVLVDEDLNTLLQNQQSDFNALLTHAT